MNNYAIITALVSIIGYFLRDLHTRQKQTEKDVLSGHDKIIELNGKIKQIESVQSSGFTHMEKLFEEKFKGIDSKLEHMNLNIKSTSMYFQMLVDEKNDKR